MDLGLSPVRKGVPQLVLILVPQKLGLRSLRGGHCQTSPETSKWT